MVRATRPGVKQGIARHFEGWQPGLVAVFIAGSVAALVVPRSVDPSEIPDPAVDQRALTRSHQADEALARAAQREELDADVRALGSAIREYGRADADPGSKDKVLARDHVIDAAVRAVPQGTDALLRLRAYQLHAFVRAVRTWEATGVQTTDLVELGGSFMRAMGRSFRVRGRHVTMDDAAIAAAFKKRWREITGIEGDAYAVPIDEERALYRFLLRRPAIPEDVPAGFESSYADQFRLRKLDELAKIDASYPILLARGILHYRLGNYPLALQELQRYLEASPNGPNTLRARNYFKAAFSRGRGFD